MLTRNDVEDALQYMERHGLVRLGRPLNKWYQLYCPFHSNGQEHRPSCGCALEEEVSNGRTYSAGFFNCFACGAKYSLGEGIKQILSLHNTSIEAHPELKKYVENTSNSSQDSLVPEDVMSIISNKFAVEYLKLRTRTAPRPVISEAELATYRFTVPYMYQRKLTDEVIAKYDVGFDGNYIPPGRKKPCPCITFPVRSQTGETLFIVRRSIEGKFFFMPNDIEKSLYGIYELPPETKEVIVCESIFNALTCVVYGRPAVALLGTGSEHTINQLLRLGASSYVLCLDNDEAGKNGTARIKKKLMTHALVWTMTIPWKDKDVNDLTKEEFELCYNNRE